MDLSRALKMMHFYVTSLILIAFAILVSSRSESLARHLQLVLGYANPQRAPLFHCHHPDTIPGQYLVKLERGHSLENHREAVGQSLSDANLVILSLDASEITYSVTFDTASLAAVRADPGVESVQCTFSAWAIEDRVARRWRDWRVGVEPPARLLYCDRPDIVPGQYWVDLELYPARGEHEQTLYYTLNKHEQTVGNALKNGALTSMKDTEAVRYFAKLDADSLAAIREDPQVDSVECDFRGSSGQPKQIKQTSTLFGLFAGDPSNDFDFPSNDPQAPLLHCNHPGKEMPDQYVVCLERGYTLGEHRRRVGDFEDPDHGGGIDDGVGNIGTRYIAELDEISLATVRADPRVVCVECMRRCLPFWNECRGRAMDMYKERERAQRAHNDALEEMKQAQ